jgi:hypothetical protein
MCNNHDGVFPRALRVTACGSRGIWDAGEVKTPSLEKAQRPTSTALLRDSGADSGTVSSNLEVGILEICERVEIGEKRS